MQACAHSSSMNIFIERIAPLHRRFWPSGLHSPNGDRLENTFASGAAAQRASLRSEKSRKSSRCSTACTKPAAGTAHAVKARRRRRRCGRCTSVRPADQCKSGSALRAHALAGSTAVKQAAVRRQAGVERSGRRVAAQVMSMRYEASHVTNAGQGAPSTVPARLPPRSSAQMINSCVAEHQLARLDEPAGRVTAAEDARGGSSRLSGRPLARGGW